MVWALLLTILFALALAKHNDNPSFLQPEAKKSHVQVSGLPPNRIATTLLSLPDELRNKTLLQAARLHDPSTLSNILASRADIAILILKSKDRIIYEKMPKAIELLLHNDDQIKTVNIIFQYPHLVNWESIGPVNTLGEMHVMSLVDFARLCECVYSRIEKSDQPYHLYVFPSTSTVI